MTVQLCHSAVGFCWVGGRRHRLDAAPPRDGARGWHLVGHKCVRVERGPSRVRIASPFTTRINAPRRTRGPVHSPDGLNAPGLYPAFATRVTAAPSFSFARTATVRYLHKLPRGAHHGSDLGKGEGHAAFFASAAPSFVATRNLPPPPREAAPAAPASPPSFASAVLTSPASPLRRSGAPPSSPPPRAAAAARFGVDRDPSWPESSLPLASSWSPVRAPARRRGCAAAGAEYRASSGGSIGDGGSMRAAAARATASSRSLSWSNDNGAATAARWGFTMAPTTRRPASLSLAASYRQPAPRATATGASAFRMGSALSGYGRAVEDAAYQYRHKHLYGWDLASPHHSRHG